MATPPAGYATRMSKVKAVQNCSHQELSGSSPCQCVAPGLMRRAAEEAWIAAGFASDPAALSRLAEAAIRS